MKCFYHSADLDGHCSGALIKWMFPHCETIGINYGDEFPWHRIQEDTEDIFMVDFSLQPFEQMIKLHELSNGRLIWIDHHISAIKEYNDWANTNLITNLIRGFRRDGIGACALVWEFLTSQKIPTFAKLLAEYDVWDHSDPRTLSFQYGMRLQDNTLPENEIFWSSLFDVEIVNRITEDGGIVLKYQNAENKKYIDACGFETQLDDLRCIAINKMLTNSQIFDSVWDQSKYDVMLTFGFRKGQWTVSLYTDKPDVDVSVIAKNYGGGGHKGAAGFQCKELPFELK